MKILLISSLVVAHFAPNAPESPASKAFEKMKTLVGHWEGPMGEGAEAMNATVDYKLTGNGTALVETLGAGSPYEMVSVYHMDGDNLMMTHYCGAGNQPTMRFKAGKNANEVFFDFVRGSNMKPTDMHMHSVKFTFDGPDHVKADWLSFSDGKPGMSANFDFRRKK